MAEHAQGCPLHELQPFYTLVLGLPSSFYHPAAFPTLQFGHRAFAHTIPFLRDSLQATPAYFSPFYILPQQHESPFLALGTGDCCERDLGVIPITS